METISITVNGRVAAEPYQSVTSGGTAKTALDLEVSVPAIGGGDTGVRWVRVVAFGALATRVAGSVTVNDRVTVRASDLSVRAWVRDKTGKASGGVTLRAYDIAASMQSDTLTTGQAARRAARHAAAAGHPTGLPASEQADARVLAGVTT